MIQSFLIKNYRLFKELEIKSLKRVNLIVGGNNTGKSALLEALLIYSSKGDIRTLNALLHQRGEWLDIGAHLSKREQTNSYLENYQELFPERKIDYGSDSSVISVGEGEEKNFITLKLKYNTERVLYYFVQGRPGADYNPTSNMAERVFSEGKENYMLTNDIPLEPDVVSSFSQQFIQAYSRPEHNHLLWDEIQLTPQEDFIIEALRIIEPRIDRLAFDSVTKKAKVRLQGESKPLTLSSMGDGINRILSIALAMVRCEGSIFLIDEFENGLHWSVQENLWKIIFKLAQELDIQVFATTHSTDTIRTLAKVTEGEYQENTKFIKLSNKKGILKAIEYDFENILIALEDDIEIR
ncbi:MAG: ATP-binding protein [Microscillaceae bacterium]|nr:ATP-binding protein [Microscillaceae bacterium]